LSRRVEALAEGIGVEIGGDAADASKMSIVFTASGDEDLFPLVDTIVSRAPKMRHWQVVALRPALGEDFEVSFEGWTVRAHDVWLRLHYPLKGSDRISIEIATTGGWRSGNKDAQQTAALMAVESALGERAFALMVTVQGFVVCPEAPSEAGWTALLEFARRVNGRAAPA
jgi:hypothetical protein